MKRFTFPRYIGRRVSRIDAEQERFERPEAYEYARSFLIRMAGARARLPRSSEDKRRIVHYAMEYLFRHQPVSHQNSLTTLRTNIERSHERGFGESQPTWAMKQLVNLTGDFAKRDHLRQLKNEPPPIKWMEEPLDFRMLPDQLIARFHKVQRRNAGKTRASERTKDSLLRILGRVIARNGVQTLKQKSPNLSDRKLARFEKELAALEYNRLLFMGRDKHERRRLFAVLHPWEDVAIGRLVAEYGLHAESAYSRAANRTGGIIRTGLIKATARSPGFAKMMRQKVALPEIGFPWVNIRQLGKRRELYDAPAWKGQSREHERLPYLLDWEHFKMRHPNQRRILKAERKLQRTRK